jgi:hypothetical protein
MKATALLSSAVLAIVASAAMGGNIATTDATEKDHVSREGRTAVVGEEEAKGAREIPAAAAGDKETDTGQAAPSVARADLTEQEEQGPALTATDATGPADQKNWLVDIGDLRGRQWPSTDDANPLSLGLSLAANDQDGQTPSAGQDAPPSTKDEDGSHSDLAKQTQNPVADLISLPFQNNALFGQGRDDSVAYNLNIQPVIPMNVTEDWNWIHRAIIPINYLPSTDHGIGSTGGLGDIQYQGYLSPAKPGKIIWGLGPVVQFPSATDERLGTEKWAMGPGLVALTMDGPWVVGCLVNNIWSFCGDGGRRDVNLMTIQPIINYNLPKGWYLSSVPVITANWEADSSDRWTVPLGGGIGKVLKIGKQPVNIKFQGFYNVVSPSNGADWSLQLQIQLLFPK